VQILTNPIPISTLNVRESPKFPHLLGNGGRGTRRWRQILDQKWKYGRFAHAQCTAVIIIGTDHCGIGYGADTTFHRTYF